MSLFTEKLEENRQVGKDEATSKERLAYLRKTAAAGTAGTIEWKKWTVADAGTIKDIAEEAARLAETIKTTSVLAKTAMSVVKVISELQSANPFLKALDLLADEVIKALQDMKEAGYYYLLVDPYLTQNVQPTKKKAYGFEVLRDDSGRQLSWNPTATNPEATTIHKDGVPFDMQDLFEPKIAMPRKLVVGGWSPYSDWWGLPDPFKALTPFPMYSAQTVLDTMAEAFKDEGDIPRYETNINTGSTTVNPAKGKIVYDDAGQPYSGWDPSIKQYPLALWNMGEKSGQTGDHTSDFLKKGGWKSERVQLNKRIYSGKPNIQGSTIDGIGSSAIVMLIAAPSYKVFVESFFAFAKLFEEIPEFMEASYGNIMDTYNAWADPDPQLITLTMCDSKYGLFAVGDVIRGINYGGLGKITEIVSTDTSSIVSNALYTITDDKGETKKRYFEKNMNKDSRYQDMVIKIKPIPTKENGVESFTPQDAVREQEKRGPIGKGDEEFDNWMTKGQETAQMLAPVEGQNIKTKRIYAKYGTVSMQKLVEPKDAIPPNFKSIQANQIIPMWNEFFEYLENFVQGIKGYTATAGAFIQDIIDVLEELIKDLENMISTIEKFLKFFEVDLSKAGIYALHVKNNREGNEGLANAIQYSGGLPAGLGYAAGILFVGVDIGGVNAINTIAPILIGGSFS